MNLISKVVEEFVKHSRFALLWLAGLFSAAKRCERLGHVDRQFQYQAVIKTTNYYRAVADSAVMYRRECQRCEKVLEEPEFERLGGIAELTMSTDEHEELRSRGYVLLGHREIARDAARDVLRMVK